MISGTSVRPSARTVLAFLAVFCTALLSTVLMGPSPARAASATEQCGGNLPFGRIAVCPSIKGTHKDVFRITTTAADDLLFTQMGRSTGEWITGQVTAPDGTSVCGVTVDAGTCRLGPAGTYKLTLSTAYGTGTGDYSISVQSLRTPVGCKTLPSGFFSFTATGADASLADGAAARCFAFDQPQGSVLYQPVFSMQGSPYMQSQLYDGQGNVLCGIYGNCTLSSAGPYRMFFYDYYGGATTGTLRMPRISAPVAAGCPVVGVRPFGDQTPYASGTVPVGFATCQRLRATAAGAVNIRFSPSQGVSWNLYSPTGSVVCDDYSQLRTCPIPAAGDYALIAQNRSDFGQPVAYQTAVTALYSGSGCAAVTATRWDQAAIVVHQTAGAQLNCQPFDGEAGDRIMAYRAPDAYNDLYADIYDSAGNVVCPGYTEEDGCVLPATGRYRVVSYLGTWGSDQQPDATYRLQIRRLNAPEGCPQATVGAYGTAPTAGNIRCRVVDIPAAGIYVLKPVDAGNHMYYYTIYNPDGTKLSTYCSPLCTFPAAGRYTLVLDGSNLSSLYDTDFAYALTTLPAKATGCPAVATDPAAPGKRDGQISGPGQFDCVQLDAAAGTRVTLVEPNGSSGAGRPTGTIFDANGDYVCDSAYPFRQESCELTGAAPFTFVYSAPDQAPTGAYSMQVIRVSGDSGCTVLPQSPTGMTVTASAGHYSACFAVPADQHAASEKFTYQVTAGTGTASLAVYDANGYRYCGSLLYEGPTRTITCTLPAGPYTVLVQTTATDGTVQVAHQAA